MYSNLDSNKYETLLKSVASLSRLYSDSEVPLIHSRFIEKLFVETSLNEIRDLSRQDISFDCLVNKNTGVGIKTFRGDTNVSLEKIAEFNNLSSSFEGLDTHALAETVSLARNNRIISDAKEVEADLNNSYYHCLVRRSGAAFIHEEPFELIDVRNLSLIPNTRSRNPSFTDGKSQYSFNRSKSTLLKNFELNKHFNSKRIDIPIIPENEIFDVLINFYKDLNKDLFISEKQGSLELFTSSIDKEDFVILPLYGQKKYKYVEEKSGINAWNAGGRPRKFGESYIPIPSIVHKIKPDFFPPKDQKFRTKLPNNIIIDTKISQSGNKAFQSDPLTDLCSWLYKTIDLDINKSNLRFQRKDIYTYKDLVNVGKDSVKIIKVKNQEYHYEMHTMPLDSFEKFKNGEEDL